ncbi:MAG: DUF397 domain-containing protein [Umezawaea sp.]
MGNTAIRWFTSSYSSANAQCVEAAFIWFTSSYSSADAECVEAAFIPGHTLLRDSKLGEGSPVLAFGPARWASFTSAIADGVFDRHG